MKMNNDPAWLKRMAEKEDGCEVGVGRNLRQLSANQLLGLMDPVLADYSAALDEIRRRLEVEPLCPDSPDGNHHVAPIGGDEEWLPSKAPCYYCGEKQAL